MPWFDHESLCVRQHVQLDENCDSVGTVVMMEAERPGFPIVIVFARLAADAALPAFRQFGQVFDPSFALFVVHGVSFHLWFGLDGFKSS